MRFGLLHEALHADDLGFIEAVATHNSLTTQALVDEWFDNEYMERVQGGHITQLWMKLGEQSLPEGVLAAHPLAGLSGLCVAQTAAETLDLGGPGQQPLDRLRVQPGSITHLSLSGVPSDLEVIFPSELEVLDVTGMDLSRLVTTRLKWCRKGAVVRCTEGQSRAWPVLKKLRARKEKVADTAAGQARLREHENEKLLRWLVKAPACDAPTAHHIWRRLEGTGATTITRAVERRFGIPTDGEEDSVS
ncbi:MAG: hypothetical protein ACI8S6_004939 [Myxococcota bacterium]